MTRVRVEDCAMHAHCSPDYGTGFEPPEVSCDDCHEGVFYDHHLMGFGHYRRCCTCYERRQRGAK